MRPKTHWGFDIAECMIHDEFLMDAFSTERLHLRAKAVASNIKKLDGYEVSVMAGVLNEHVRALGEEGCAPACLVGPRAPFPGAEHIVVADTCHYFGVCFCVGDFAFRGTELGAILACCQDESCCCVLVEKATLLKSISAHSSQHSVATPTREFWQMHEVVPCAAWQIDGAMVTAVML